MRFTISSQGDMVKLPFFHNNFLQFATKTRALAIHVAIKNKIQHLAKITPLNHQQVKEHYVSRLTLVQEAAIIDAVDIF